MNGIEPVFFGLPETNASGTGIGKEAEAALAKANGADTAPALAVWADEIQNQGLKGISCRIHTEQGEFSALVPIPGQHMVYNALAGTAVGLTYGLTLEQIKQGI